MQKNTSKQVTVSIIITNYNYAKYLNRSVRSAFVQDFQEDKYEIIVVDDSSDDWSKQIIDSYGQYIKAVYFKKNVGLAAARNAGIKKALGDYILFLDADDYLNKHIIKIESLYLDYNEEADAVACDYWLVDDNEDTIGRNSCIDMPIACGIMFRKKCLIDIGMYDENFKMWEEKDLRIRFLKKYKIDHLAMPLYRYRQHDTNMTKDKEKDLKFTNELIKKHKAEKL